MFLCLIYVSVTNLQDIPITLVSLAGNSGGFSLESVPTADSLNLDGQRERETIDFTKMRYHVETGQLIKIGPPMNTFTLFN